MRLSRPVFPFALLAVAVLAACGGGGGGGSTAPAPPAVVVATSTPAPTSATASLTLGSTPVSTQFPTLASGISGALTLPALASGAAGTSVSATLAAALPANLPVVADVHRSPQAIGVTLTPIAYITLTAASTVGFSSPPTFTISSSSLTTPGTYYLGTYTQTGGWSTIAGPATANGGSVTLAGATGAATLPAAAQTFVVFSTTGPIPTPSPSPSPSPSPTASPTPTPVPAAAGTVGPAFAYMSATGTNTFSSAIAPSAHYGWVINISGSIISTTSGAAPSLLTDALSIKAGTSATTFGAFRQPESIFNGGAIPSRNLQLASLPQHLTPLAEPHDSEAALSDMTRLMASSQRAAVADARRSTKSLPTTIGSTNAFWVNVVPIGQVNSTYVSVPATLAGTSTHGYIWVDNTLTLAPASITAIGVDFENAYTSDVTHFASPEYTGAAPGAALVNVPCDSNGTPVVAATPGPELIPPPIGKHVVFIINSNNLGVGTGGYYSSINHLTQGFANCLTGQPKSNEASMIFIGYNTSNSLNAELQEDVVRGTAHELQHLINFVNHSVLSSTVRTEDRWVNEGLSMLAQDFAVHSMFPGLSNDAADALAHVADFFKQPHLFSLTGFTGIEPSTTTFAYNCYGCYGQAYLFQRYLYDRFGNDTYTHAMEVSPAVSLANIQTATGVATPQLIADFAVALMNSNTGFSTDPKYNFTHFNPYGSYVDQFGQTTALSGPYVLSLAPGATLNFNAYIGTFNYVQIQNSSGAGAGITTSNVGGNFGLTSGLLQF